MRGVQLLISKRNQMTCTNMLGALQLCGHRYAPHRRTKVLNPFIGLRILCIPLKVVVSDGYVITLRSSEEKGRKFSLLTSRRHAG